MSDGKTTEEKQTGRIGRGSRGYRRGTKHGRHMQVVRDANDLPPLDPEVKPWERQPGESDKAWEAFRTYRDMAQDRSLRVVADTIGKSKSLVDRWSSRHQWNRRAYEWELELDRQARMETVREAAAMVKRHAQQSQLFMTALTQPAMALIRKIQGDPQFFDRMLVSIENDGRVEVGKTIELLRIIRDFAVAYPQIAQIERLSRGEPTSINAETTEEHGTSFARALIADREASQIASQLFERMETTIAKAVADA